MLAWLRARRDALPLLIAVALLWAIGGWYSGVGGTWHEEVSVYPSRGYRIVAEPPGDEPSPTVRIEPWCGDASRPRFVISSERPLLSVCAGDRSYPLMVSSYFEGTFYWPADLLRWLHHDDVFALRKLGLVIGSLSLYATWTLIRRLADRAVAGAAVVLAASSSCFLYAHALLVHYELLPWPLLVLAMLCLERAMKRSPRDDGEEKPATRWLVAAALCVGLAIAANIKALFIAVPLVALSARLGVRWGRIRPAQWAWMIPAAAIPIAPMIAFAIVDPAHNFGGQVSSRLGILSAARLEKLALEPLNLAVYWTDVGAYADAITNAPAAMNWATIALAWIALGYAAFALGRAVLRRSGDLVAAGAGALLLSYIGVVVLLYDQQPEANYAPLHTVFGAALGATLIAAARRFGGEAGRGKRAVALVGIAAAALGYNCVRRGDPSDNLPMSINAAAQRSLAAYLRATRSDRGEIVTTTYNLAGVLESLGHGEIAPLVAHRYLLRCSGREEAEVAPCMEARWRALLADPARRPLRAVAPLDGSIIDEQAVKFLRPTLERAAASLGLSVQREKELTTGRGVPVLVIYRVE